MLAFNCGDELLIYSVAPGGWLLGEFGGKKGYIPAKYVEKVEGVQKIAQSEATSNLKTPMVTVPPTPAHPNSPPPISLSTSPATPIEGEAPPPNEYLCPITCCLMADPVLAPDGFLYERSAITAWLTNHNTSPMKGDTMPPNPQLVPCLTLRSAILEWAEKHGKKPGIE